MILFDLGEALNDLNEKVLAFLDKNSNNPVFWCVVIIIIVGLAGCVIHYLNRK